MRQFCAFVLLVFSISVQSQEEENPPEKSKAEEKNSTPEGALRLMDQYSKAVFEDNLETLLTLYHFSTKACVNDQTKAYYSDRFRETLDGDKGQSKKYSVVNFEELKNIKETENFLKKEGLRYSTTPTHRAQVDFGENREYPWMLKAPNSVMLDLIKTRKDWKLVGFCVSSDGVQKHKKNRKSLEEAQAKALMALNKLGEEQRKEYETLLKKGEIIKAETWLQKALPQLRDDESLRSRVENLLSEELMAKVDQE